MNRDELDALPPVLDVPTAAKVLGIGRCLADDLVRRGDWPTPVLRVGKLIKIPREPLIRLVDGSGTADGRVVDASVEAWPH
jgi:hypothetical protein